MRLPLITLFVLATCATFAQQYNVLFLGNSYTNANNLPQLVHDLGAATGDTINYDSNTPGGHTLEGHASNATSIQKINSRAWDVVVLQDQSQRPSFPPSQVANEVFPYAKKLDSIIQANHECTETMFYMTWGRKNGDQQNCQFYPPLCTYWGMQQRLYESYTQMALDNRAAVAPAGAAWRNLRRVDSTFNLYTGDESHPNLAGSYLTACVFYAMITGKSPVGNTYRSSLSTNDAQLLQNIAHQTVFDSLHVWIGHGKSVYSFTEVDVFTDSISCSDSSFNASDHYWDFGDGNSSTLTDPSHTYATDGTYIVRHTASNRCKRFVSIDTVHVVGSSIENRELEKALKLYPNPASKQVQIQLLGEAQLIGVELSDLQGKKLVQKDAESTQNLTLVLPELPQGYYLMSIETTHGLIKRKLVVQ